MLWGGRIELAQAPEAPAVAPKQIWREVSLVHLAASLKNNSIFKRRSAASEEERERERERCVGSAPNF